MYKLIDISWRNNNMAEGDLAPKTAHSAGINDGKMMGIVVLVRRDRKASPCIVLLPGDAPLVLVQYRFVQN